MRLFAFPRLFLFLLSTVLWTCQLRSNKSGDSSATGTDSTTFIATDSTAAYSGYKDGSSEWHADTVMSGYRPDPIRAEGSEGSADEGEIFPVSASGPDDIEISEEHKIADLTTNDSTKGIIAYNVPDEMIVGQYHEVTMRITKDKSGKQELIEGTNHSQPIYTAGENSNITIQSIRVESVMSAELFSLDKAFEITSFSTKEQNIETLGYTEWTWNIKPLESGKHPLKLVVTVRVVNDAGAWMKDIVVFEKNIEAKANYGYTISNWFNEYWQWLSTTLAIPIFLWWRNRRKSSTDKN